MSNQEFNASDTFPNRKNIPDGIKIWDFVKSEAHGGVIFHWFTSFFDNDNKPADVSATPAIGVAVSDCRNRWLGSAWSSITNVSEHESIVRDEFSAGVLKHALRDVEKAFVKSHGGPLGPIKVFFSFLFGTRKSHVDFVKVFCLCDLRNASVGLLDSLHGGNVEVG